MLCAAFLACTAAMAQNYCQSDFFLGNNIYSYRINPADSNSRSFFGLGINNLNISAGSNIGLSTLLFPAQGGNGLVTGLHPSISSEQFLKGLKNSNNATFELNENIFALGIKGKKSYSTVEINLRALGSASLPKDIFAFVKNGSSDSAYDLSGVNASASGYLELAYGYSRRISSNLRAGARVKFLAGIAEAHSQIDKALLYVNDDEISYNLDGRVKASCALVDISDDLSDIRYSGTPKPSGYGLAIDLGAEYSPFENFTISASIIDLGALSWKYSIFAKAQGEYSFNGVTVNPDFDVDKIADQIADDILDNVSYETGNKSESGLRFIPVTANLGAKYIIPGAEMLSVGVLSSFRMSRFSCWYDIRGGAAFTPGKWFSLSANAGLNSFGKSFGVSTVLKLWILNISAGVDGYIGPVTSYENIPVPVDPVRLMARAGLSIVL